MPNDVYNKEIDGHEGIGQERSGKTGPGLPTLGGLQMLVDAYKHSWNLLIKG